MVKWVLLFLFSGFIVLGTTLYYNLGAYKEVQLTPMTHPEFHIVYKEHFGAYHKISPVIIEVETWATQNNISCSKTFGEYLDDPHTTEQDRMRSHGGCIVDGPIADLPEKFKYRLVKSHKILKAEFTGAPSIGPFVVYPEVDEWMLENSASIKGPVFEIYNIQGDKSALTEYIFPI